MDISEIVMVVTELIGVIACAVSGAMISAQRQLDTFGVVIIGCITAVGGGLIRDVIIGRTPPVIFSNEYILMVAALASLITFLVLYFCKSDFSEKSRRAESVVNFIDAIGLATFSIIGTEAAKEAGFYDNMLLAITLGTITGVGGGVLRDIMTNELPYIFRKHIYALASVFGSVLYYILDNANVERIVSIVVTCAAVVAIRMLASKYRWNMPRIENK